MHDKLEAAPHFGASAPIASLETSPVVSLDLTRIVGENLRRLRTKRGLSLQRLSRVSGVSRAMLSQVELGRSSPTINVVWKISQALAVSVASLLTDASESQLTVLRAAAARLLTSHDGAFSSRALFPLEDARSRAIEFYELRLAPGAIEKVDGYPPGTRENLVVADGRGPYPAWRASRIASKPETRSFSMPTYPTPTAARDPIPLASTSC